MLKPGNSYGEVYKAFKWKIPEYYNMGVDVCDKHAHQRYRLALIYENEKGRVEKYTFWQLKRLSNQFANTLQANGIGAGDRFGILLPQCPETGIAHIAVYKIGGIAIPLFTLFGPDALEFRLTDSEAKGVITDEANLDKILEIKDRLPKLKRIFVARGRKRDQVIDFWEALEKASVEFTPVKTHSDDPALLAYTSGTTGPPKGALHPHRMLLGHIPGVEFPHNFFPKEDDLFWTPADWAWLGGLTDVLLPSWYHGIPVLAYRAKKFDPEYAFHLMAKHGVRNSFIPPTALKMMRQVKDPYKRHKYNLRTVASGGETLGKELLDWGRTTLGININEFYGQTEVNLVVGNCAEIMEIRPGSMGKTIPGHIVEIVDDDGNFLPTGTTGNVGIKHPDPVMFLEYWKNPDATREKYVGDWYLTGDMARKDEDGYFWFVGREDDLITSAGYRIGPGEIEDCLIKHPAVALAAVVGSPDDVRGTIVKAFIVLKPEADVKENLKDEIQDFIRNRLAAHEYPREIEFVAELPMTATGKIIRKKLREKEREDKK
ncbi:MAG: acyl-CoA synthetase [Deltaproteobacteria bacterium]|nr:MAG: acyl-CoA synthetase [Deltaproteobacteria bacterium]